ncbi:hypothetical protein [Nocardioides sp. SYSU DS0663]|uniref:hypothetical protein n=1 Tax=Nocardioides sp. SYSU DS0663 TaxID=3416445 RepID=UPI003F4C584F
MSVATTPTSCTPPSTRRRTRALAAAALSSLLVLGACGDSGGGGSEGEAAELLTEEQATTALLTSEVVADGMVEVPAGAEEDDDAEGSLGCLDALDDIKEAEAPVEVDRDFEAENEFALPALTTQVVSYDDAGETADALDAFREAIEDCDSIDETDPDGARMQLEIELDDALTNEAADEQANLRATGTISAEGVEFPFGIWFAVARVDNHIVTVGLTDLTEEFGDRLDAYVTVAVDRLAAVADGEEPAGTAVEESGTVS